MILCAVVMPSRSAETAEPSLIQWQEWSPEAFAKAKAENKLVILDLEAVWCHWCHVMDKETYRNPDVARFINEHFVAIRVDQDSRPDVSKQYENWGWPATIMFAPDGTELVKRAGYIPPERMESVLKAVVEDPTPGPSARASAPQAEALPPPSELVKELEARYESSYDKEHGAWGFIHKFLDGPSTEYAMEMGRRGDKSREEMARKTLDGQLNIVDPAWGGVYQYSTGGVWTEPHFEKIMSMQADNLRVYSIAYRLYGDPRYLEAARKIRGYLDRFLKSRNGGFYTSQNADLVDGVHSAEYFALPDAGRVKLGVPRVDKHQYARENGWAISALTDFYAATADKKVLKEARKAARWVKKNRSLGNGGFSHDEKDVSGPYLGDSLAMANAFLSLYAADADRAWLADSVAAAGFIKKNFRATNGDGLVPFAAGKDTPLKPQPNSDENIAAARFFARLHQYTGNAEDRETAESTLRFLSQPGVSSQGTAGSLLLAQREVTTAPLHLVTVGRKNDKAALKLHQAALFFPATFARVEWWDRKEGPLPNADVEYPELDKAAAFSCGQGRCSLPAFTPEQLRAKARSL